MNRNIKTVYSICMWDDIENCGEMSIKTSKTPSIICRKNKVQERFKLYLHLSVPFFCADFIFKLENSSETFLPPRHQQKMKVDLEKCFVSLGCFRDIIIRTHSQIYKQLVHLAVPVFRIRTLEPTICQHLLSTSLSSYT